MKHPLGAALRNGRVASLLIVLLAQRVAGLDCDPGSFAATPTECAGCTAGTMALGFGNTACVDIPNDLEAAIVANALAQCKIACDVTYTTDTYMCDLYTFVSSGGFSCKCHGFTFTSPAHATTKAMKCKAFCDDVKGMAVASTTPAELARVEADYRGDAPSGLACSDCVQCNGILVQLSGPSTMCGGCRTSTPIHTPLRDQKCKSQCAFAVNNVIGKMCPAGQRAAYKANDVLVDSTKPCTLCEAGKAKGVRGFQGSCADCPPGRITTTPAGSSVCGPYQCLPGETRQLDAVTGEKLDVCDPCPEGFGCNGIVDTQCVAMEYAAGGSVSCTTCPDAKYSTTVGASECKICEKGSKCIGAVKTECGETTYAEAGAVSCLTCADSKYSTAVGASACKTCEEGSKCLGGIKTECAAAKYAEAGAVRCLTCGECCFSFPNMTGFL